MTVTAVFKFLYIQMYYDLSTPIRIIGPVKKEVIDVDQLSSGSEELPIYDQFVDVRTQHL